jgi:energy-coupling factor transport system permease protein
MPDRLARLGTARLPRDLHPVAWWLWSVGLAVAASFTTNPWLLLLLVGVACVAVAARRGDQPWADSFRIYLWLGVAIVVIRVGFRLLLGGGDGGRVLLDLPQIPLPGWTLGLRLLGPVTQESLLAGLYDGLRLAAIVICVGAANALANPKRLLRSVPPALYEVGSALVVAVTVLPQLADSVRRVRAAQTLRGGDNRRVRGLRRVLVPVLEDALERSLALAAGMDTRGYGRTSGASPRARRTTGTLMLVGLAALCVGVYAGLDSTAPAWLGRPMLVLGVLVSLVAVRLAGGRVARSRYRPDVWRWPETVVAGSGLLVGAAGWWMSQHQLTVAYPSLTAAPTLSLLGLAAPLVGLAGALCAPPVTARAAAPPPVPPAPPAPPAPPRTAALAEAGGPA